MLSDAALSDAALPEEIGGSSPARGVEARPAVTNS
jgi:hypothetical protein